MHVSEILTGLVSFVLLSLVISIAASSYHTITGAEAVAMPLHQETLRTQQRELSNTCLSGVQRYHCAGVNILVQDCLDPAEGSVLRFCSGGCVVDESVGASCPKPIGYGIG